MPAGATRWDGGAGARGANRRTAESMNTPPDAARRFLIRRRVIAGTVVLVAVLAVMALVFDVFGRRPAAQVNATFLRFETSADGTSIVALIVLTNVSRDAYYHRLVNATGLAPNWLPLGSYFEADVSNPLPNWNPHPLTTGSSSTIRRAPLVVTNQFELPADGRRGRILVQYLEKESPAPEWLQKIGVALGLQSGITCIVRWVEWDQQIQCPLVRPDGTVEPARLIPKGKRNAQ
jgi:hypothetical protein